MRLSRLTSPLIQRFWASYFLVVALTPTDCHESTKNEAELSILDYIA
ncbi:MAG: hypothetical protein HOO87_14310 [Methyloglobulus sp.]|nr:hypothetical protein [Methyloglobulus sp.]